MWVTAEKRFVWHVCLRNPFPPFLLGIPSIHSLPEAGSWEPQYVPPALHFGCIMPIPSLQLQKEDLSYAEKQRVWLQSCGLQELFEIHWLCSQLCHETAANQWTIVEIELLATVGWKWGCQPFSCRCSQNVTYCRKEICLTCLFKESIPTIPFGSSQHPVPTRSLRFLRAEVRSTSSALWLHHAHPFVAAELWSPRFVTIHWLFSQSWYATAESQWRILEIQLLPTAVGCKWGCQPFSCPCSKNVTHCRKEMCSRCLFQESTPCIPLPISTTNWWYLWSLQTWFRQICCKKISVLRVGNL